MFMKCVNCKLEKENSLFQRRTKYRGFCNDCIIEIKRIYGKDHYYKYKRSEKSIIYRIDFEDGDFYIGSSDQILKERLRIHFSHAFNDNTSMKISSKIRDFFDHSTQYLKLLQFCSVIEEVEKDKRYDREKFWIKTLKPNLNTNTFKGKKPSNKIKKGPKKGENHPNSKLKEDDIIKIRDMYKDKRVSQQKIARLFNVDVMTINQIVNFKTWKEVK